MDYKAVAKNSLRGNWFISAMVNLVAIIIGANATLYVRDFFSFVTNSSTDISYAYENEIITKNFFIFLSVLITVFTVLQFVKFAIGLIIGGPCQLGYSIYFLNLHDGREAKFGDLFSQFSRFKDGFLLNLLITIFVFLWSCLLFIPGIIKSLSYSMAPYILAENPGMTARQAIRESKKMMKGNKGELFGLQLSFFGWAFLCLIPMFIPTFLYSSIIWGDTSPYWMIIFIPLFLIYLFAYAYLSSYMGASVAAFYRNLQAEQAEENAEK